MESKEKWAMVLKFLTVLGVIAIVIVALVFMGQKNEPQNQFSVSATGKVFARPDIANINIGLKTEIKKTAAEAVKENTDKMNTIIRALKELEIEEKDIQTTNYFLNPVYDWTETTGQRLKGYEVSQNVTVKIRELEKIGETIAMTTAKGANQVGNISFTIDDEFALRNEARDKAIQKAKEKAEQIVAATGMKLGKIVNVYESQSYYPTPINYAREMSYGLGAKDEASAAPEIQVGQNEVQVEVTVVWKVE